MTSSTGRVRDYRLYALRLEHGKYYVGLTAYKDVRVRYEQHVVGTGAHWTAIHPPVGIIEVRELGVMSESEAAQLEDLMTQEYMGVYGTNSVRGGRWTRVKQLANDHHAYYVPPKKRKRSRSVQRERAAVRLDEACLDTELGWLRTI